MQDVTPYKPPTSPSSVEKLGPANVGQAMAIILTRMLL